MTLETLPLIDVTTSCAKAMREGSTKLSQLDKMLKGFRSRGQKAMVFCEMPEMMTLLQVFLHKHSHSFVCIDQGMTNSEKLAALNHFGANGVLVALVVVCEIVAAILVLYVFVDQIQTKTREFMEMTLQKDYILPGPGDGKF